MRNEIILIGPVGVGKTTTSKLLAESLGLQRVAMDDLIFSYFSEMGFEENHWKQIGERLGRPAAYRYLKVFGSYGVKRLLDEHRNCVFDFGGGGVMGEFPDEMAAMKTLLSEFSNVVLLLPCSDKNETLQFLYQRLKIQPSGWTILEHLVNHPTHELLAKFTVYVKDKTPEQVRDEILALVLTPNQPATNALKLEVVEEPDAGLIDFFDKRIEEFNFARWDIKVKRPIAVKISDTGGNIVAGASAKSFGFWLLLENLWVREDQRGRDLGSRVLSALTDAASARGCKYVLLETLDFQARPFYEKHGFSLMWTQENYPRVGRKFWMFKELS